jgi:hypothetical protein
VGRWNAEDSAGRVTARTALAFTLFFAPFVADIAE